MPGPPRLIDELLQRRVLILTGKGGVGKSTTSAALALIAANRDKRVLVVEVDAKGNVPDFFDTRRVGFKYRRLHKNLWGLSMQPRASMQEYLSLMLHVPGFSLRPMQGFIEYTSGAIPGLKEILVTGKVYFEEKATDEGQPRWDLVGCRRRSDRARCLAAGRRSAPGGAGQIGADPRPGGADRRTAGRPGAYCRGAGHYRGGDAGQRNH